MEAHQKEQLLICVLEICEMLVESGAEIYRAEESASRICAAYGMGRTDVYATTSNIILSVEDGSHIKTHTRRIKSISTDFDKVDRLNNLVRRMSAEPLSLTEVRREIHQIKESPVFSAWLQLLVYGGIAGAFCLFFGARTWNEVTAASLIGLLVGGCFRGVEALKINRLLARFLCSFLACTMALLCSRLRWIDGADHVIIGNMMTLIPGIGLTNSLRDLFTGDSISGSLRLIEAILLALAIAGGYLLAAFLIGGGAA